MDLMDKLYNHSNAPGLRPSTLIVPPCPLESTKYPESLSSYIIRLANAHCISVGQLVKQFLQPRVSSKQSGHILHRCNDGYVTNGAGLLGSELFRIMKKLVTSADPNCYSSFYFLQSLIGTSYKSFLSKELSWCPLCLEEHEPYLPLYWHSSQVSCCLKHRVKLISSCPKCGAKLNVLSASTVIRSCSTCGALLSAKATQEYELETATEKELWIARSINDLAIHHEKLSQSNLLENFRGNLRRVCDDYSSISNAERKLGFSETLFQRWLSRNRPNFSELVEFTYRIKLPLIDLLTPLIDQKDKPACYFYPKFEPDRRTHDDTHENEVIERLNKIIETKEVVSVKSLARELGTSEGYLQYRFRELLNEIIEIRSLHLKQEHEEEQQKLLKDAALAAIQLMAQGKYFGGRRMTKSFSERTGHKTLSNKRLLKFIKSENRNLLNDLPMAFREKLSPTFNKES
jgi:AraC-like DNA-binding protein